MKVPGFLVVALLLILGVIGLLAPNRLFVLAHYTTTPAGIYVAATVRLAIGAILLGVASRSRLPNVLRGLGVLALVGGLATLFIGSDGAQSVARWAATYDTVIPRVFGVFAVAIGIVIAYAIGEKNWFTRANEQN